MIATANQINRTTHDWQKIAGDIVEVEQIGTTLYGFTSEIGSLRLLKKYRTSIAADCGFSLNLGKFYFSIELPN